MCKHAINSSWLKWKLCLKCLLPTQLKRKCFKVRLSAKPLRKVFIIKMQLLSPHPVSCVLRNNRRIPVLLHRRCFLYKNLWRLKIRKSFSSSDVDIPIIPIPDQQPLLKKPVEECLSWSNKNLPSDLFQWILGFSPFGSLFPDVSLKEALSSWRFSLVNSLPSHFFQATPAAPLWLATAPLIWEVTMNHLPDCQSHTTSKLPTPAQSGILGLVPTVRICPFLVQLSPRSGLHTEE